MKIGRTIVLPLAISALVIAGAGAVLAVAGPVAPAPVAEPAAAPTAPPAAAAPAKAPFLQAVLDGLVAKGTITSAQEQSILDAWIAKRGALKADRAQLRSILADGVITQAELDQLPSDSPLRALEPLLKNGQISVADLRALGRGILRDLRMGGALPPALLGGQPSPSPSAGG